MRVTRRVTLMYMHTHTHAHASATMFYTWCISQLLWEEIYALNSVLAPVPAARPFPLSVLRKLTLSRVRKHV